MKDPEECSSELSEAVRSCDFKKARHLAAIRVAEMMERTDSPREVKALSISLANLLDDCERARIAEAEEETPLDAILRAADEAEANWQAGNNGFSRFKKW